MENAAPRRNVELKARVADLEAARQIARGVATAALGEQHQLDVYFRVPAGRLKLRVINRTHGQLVAYKRPDAATAKTSSYYLVDAIDPVGLKQALSSACGVLVEVDKVREIYLRDKVRIHLDRVAGLGDFLEFEAVLGPTDQVADGERQVAELAALFGLQPAQLQSGSYSDLILSHTAEGDERGTVGRSGTVVH